jgi:hypothetical protein
MTKRTLLTVTPFCSPNFAYPAPAYLARYIRRSGRDIAQADLSLETLLGLFSRRGLARVFGAAEWFRGYLPPATRRMVESKDRYLDTVETVIHYLQGRDPSLAYRLCHRDFLPRGENFEEHRGFDAYDQTSNTFPIYDRATFIGTLYLYDIAALVRQAVFPYFQITMNDRFHDDFVHWCATFDRMRVELERPPNAIDEILYEALDKHLASFLPDVVGVTVPFARNLYWALRIGKRAKEWNINTTVVAGGGLFNTSMRTPSEPRMFDYIDYLTLDDGERPLTSILEHLEGTRSQDKLKRTFFRTGRTIVSSDGCEELDAAHEETGAPDYIGYRFHDYFNTLETINVSQRAFLAGWWNKLTMAHGCYWKKCSFCDIHLSYIGDYETASARNLVDKVQEIIAQSGHTGFHFVDEALPPKIMRDFALEVLRRRLNISWHGMLRFDRAFTPDLCRLLAASGLIGAFGGLEVASDRLLKLMKKGTSVEQVAMVCKNFRDAGVRVHAYIMYGFPTQSAQETMDALDVVRQLFLNGLISSASWAKFGVTPHSPIGRNPREYGITLLPTPQNAFIEQVMAHLDPANDHGRFTYGLESALSFFGQGQHHLTPVEGWFSFPVPPVSIDRDLIFKVMEARRRAMGEPALTELRSDKRLLWLGGPFSVQAMYTEEGKEPLIQLILHQRAGDVRLPIPVRWSWWIGNILTRARPTVEGALPIKGMEGLLWEITGSEVWKVLREQGLIITEGGGTSAVDTGAPQIAAAPEFAILAS